MITHVMSDGTRRKSIEGLVVPAKHPVYKIIQKMEEEGVMENGRKATRKTKTA